ncbi:hypothetical protein JHD50_12025 [Sulfurimonas sp. MAG313]|nr:hypothetical protein [Sulfurimonas sp. MAG313]MDF1882017.1 hypothetical protein [Sulfurimonas sp. MAG313]
MTPFKTLDLKHIIVAMEEVHGDSLALADNEHRFRIISNENYENKFALKLANAKTDKSNHNIDFSKDGKLLAFTEINKPVIRIIDTGAKKVLHSFLKHEDDIESLQFSPNGKYLASGGIDGKVFLWSIKRGGFISRFPSHPDYVAFLKFSPNSDYLISCGFEGAMLCTNINTRAKPKKYKQHKSRVTALCFASNHVIITGSKEGEIVVMNYLSGEILARFMTPHGETRGLVCDGKVIYVSGTQTAIAIYSLETFEPIATHYIAAPGVPSCLDFNADKSHLIVGCLNGKLAYYNLENEDELRDAISLKDYKNAYEIIQTNPLLEFCDAKKSFDNTWKKTYDSAFSLFVKKENSKATALLESFRGIPGITTQIQALVRDFASYERFTQLIANKKLSAAYSMVEQFPSLEKTPLFIKIETLWENSFEKAKKHMLSKNDAGTAKLILDSFSSVGKKSPLIQTLLYDTDVFRDLMQGLKDKDFKKLLTIIAQHKHLQETIEYKKAMQLAEKVFDEAKKKLKEKDFETVHTFATLILNVPHLHDKAEVLDNYALCAQEFMQAYEAKDYHRAYTLIDEHPFLIELSEAQELEQNWEDLVDKAEEYAYNAKVKELKESFADFFTLSSRANKVGILLKTAYLVQIKKYASSSKLSNADVIRAIKLYITLLSYDPEIEVIIKKLQKLRSLELDLGEDEMEIKDDDVWLKHTNGNIPFMIFKPA